MNNEPVAWWARNRNTGVGYVQTNQPTRMDKVSNEYLPLYTHPAKTLTDEEIRHIQAQCHLKDVGYDTFIMRFARAILRKAQEK
jgi:hypothetical protein